MKNFRICIIATLILWVQTSLALLPIPSNLTKANANKILQILGYGSAAKILDDPYPLGGFDGLELGFSNESLQTDQISALGSGARQQGQTNYNMLTIGKGIYNNIDTFLNFSLMGQQENINNVGVQFRWGFYQASYLPIYLSAVVHGNAFNCQNLIITNTLGLDLIAGFKGGDVTMFLGGGPIRAQGQISGGSGGVTSSGQALGLGIMDSRFITGINVKLGHYFIAGEVDSYSTTVYSAKIGYRF